MPVSIRRATALGLFVIAALASACSGSSTPQDAAPDAGDVQGTDTGDVTLDVARDATDVPPALDAADVPPPLDVIDVPPALDAADVPPPRDATDVARPDAPADAGRVPVNHRVDDSACAGPAPAGNCSFTGGPGVCQMDSQCTTGTNGRCVMSNGGAVICRCTYDACARDTECASGQACACHGTAYTGNAGSTCAPGNCRVDGDCGAAGYCSPSRNAASCAGLAGYYCHTPRDLCTDDADCPSAMGPQLCAYASSSARWECITELFCP